LYIRQVSLTDSSITQKIGAFAGGRETVNQFTVNQLGDGCVIFTVEWSQAMMVPISSPSIESLPESKSIVPLRESAMMTRSVLAIATVASFAMLACSMFAIGWVGLALLGY
jgi:hypothetical protein